MKYNMAREYLWWAHARCAPENYTMQQTWYKMDLLGEGRRVRNWGRDRGRQTEEAKSFGQKK